MAERITHHGQAGWILSDEELTAIVEAIGGFLWMGNNLHNAATETFKEMYGSAMVDARPIYTSLVEQQEAA